MKKKYQFEPIGSFVIFFEIYKLCIIVGQA